VSTRSFAVRAPISAVSQYSTADQDMRHLRFPAEHWYYSRQSDLLLYRVLIFPSHVWFIWYWDLKQNR